MAISANQRTRPNKTSNRTTDTLVSPVSAETMAEFIGLSTPLSESDEALINGLLLASCQYYIDYYNNELLSRNYTLKFDSHPKQQEGFSGLGYSPAVSTWWIDFPVWPVTSVSSVTVDGDTLTLTDDYTLDFSSKPARLELNARCGKDIVISYASGCAVAADIPPSVLSGISLMTAYMYDHRGGCDASSAASNSGAALMWQSTKIYLSL